VTEDGVFSAALSRYAQGLLLQTDEGAGSAAARDAFRDAHRLDPDAGPPLALAVLNLMEAECFDEALAILEARCARHPDSAETWTMLGRVAETAGKPLRAAQAFARARISLGDEATDTDIVLAEIRNRFKAEDDRTAARLLRRFAANTNLPPDLVHTPLLWARHFVLDAKTPERALPVIATMIETAATPASKAAALTFYGDVQILAGATNRGIRAYWQALESDPVHLSAAQRIASDLRRRSDTNAVVRLAARISKDRHPLPTALVTAAAWTLFDRPEDAADALLAGHAAFTRTGAHPPESYYLTLGAALDERDRDDRAAAIFSEAISVHTNAHAVMNHLAYMWAVNNERLDEALALAERALNHEPRNHAYLDTLGWVYYRLGRLRDALTQLLLAARLAPQEDGVILDHIGDVLHDLGRREEAVAFWRRALALSPDLPGLAGKLDAGR